MLCGLRRIVLSGGLGETRESLGELEKAVETLACGSCSHSISRPPKLSLVFLYFDRNTVHVFYFLNVTATYCMLLNLEKKNSSPETQQCI